LLFPIRDPAAGRSLLLFNPLIEVFAFESPLTAYLEGW
jgi:hypothetical protein